MVKTLIVLFTIGVTSVALSLISTVCLFRLDEECPVPLAVSAPLLIVGLATLLPVLVSLWAYGVDRRRENEEMRQLFEEKKESIRFLSASTEYDDNFRHCSTRLVVYLYASHFLAAWGDRMWQFAIPILFMEIFVDTLLPSALFSLVTYVSCVLAMPYVGQWVDRSNRLSIMSWSIVLENLTIIASSSIMGAILYMTNADGVHRPIWTWKLVFMFTLVMLSGGVGQVLNNAQSLAMERDWLVVIAKHLPRRVNDGDLPQQPSSKLLTSFNTSMRRIDLCCKILSPSAFGFIMEYSGDDPTTRATIGAAIVAVWNFLSFPLELALTRDVYEFIPQLTRASVPNEAPRPSSKSIAFEFLDHWRAYINHSVFLVSVSFCALYMTVLDGGALNTAYLKWRGMSEGILGMSRGAGAVFGLGGTFVFPRLLKFLGSVERTSVVSVWCFWFSLVPVMVAFALVGESHLSDYLMLISMVLSRTFLWCTDLAETQIMQERVEPESRGAINAMQNASSQLFFIAILLIGVIYHEPFQFSHLIMFSGAAVFAAACGFSVWFAKFS